MEYFLSVLLNTGIYVITTAYVFIYIGVLISLIKQRFIRKIYLYGRKIYDKKRRANNTKDLQKEYVNYNNAFILSDSSDHIMTYVFKKNYQPLSDTRHASVNNGFLEIQTFQAFDLHANSLKNRILSVLIMMIVPLIFIVIVCTCLFNGFVHGQAYCNDLRLFIEGFYFNELEKKMISYVKAYRKETKLNSSIRKTLKKITLQENTQTINCTQKNIKELL